MRQAQDQFCESASDSSHSPCSWCSRRCRGLYDNPGRAHVRVLVHELARALLAAALGRSSAIVISMAGGQTSLLGLPFHGIGLIACSLAGSLANGLFALACMPLARQAFAAALGPLLGALTLSHAVWGAIQLLPVVPTRLGTAIASRLSPSLRFAHASASLAFTLIGGGMLISITRSVLAGRAGRPVGDRMFEVTNPDRARRDLGTEGSAWMR